MLGTFSPTPLVSDPNIHHDKCVAHVLWCMPGYLISGFLWCRWRGKRSRHSRRVRNPHLYVSAERPMCIQAHGVEDSILLTVSEVLTHLSYKPHSTSVPYPKMQHFVAEMCVHFEGILPKGPYPPCLRMADRALLAGYPWFLLQNGALWDPCSTLFWSELGREKCVWYLFQPKNYTWLFIYHVLLRFGKGWFHPCFSCSLHRHDPKQLSRVCV